LTADAAAAPARLLYIDWLRGLAVVLMFEAHLYPAYLAPAHHGSRSFMWSKVFAGYAAPLFLFVAGVGMALALASALGKGRSWRDARRTACKRGGQILLAALAFRLQCHLLGGGALAQLLRVDILNCIGASMLIAGALLLPRERAIVAWRALAAVALVVAAAPHAAATAFPKHAWPLTDYLATPKEWLFPLLPWSAFLFAGLAAGTLWVRASSARTMVATLVAGAALVAVAYWGSRRRELHFLFLGGSRREEPCYLLAHLGWPLVVAAVGFALQRLADPASFGPLRQLGRTSLLVYWVHVELVYGHLSGGYVLDLKKRLDFGEASVALAALTALMLALSWWRTRYLGAFRAAALFEHLWAELVRFVREAWRRSRVRGGN
jgi:uncharacterized membrane protein